MGVCPIRYYTTLPNDFKIRYRLYGFSLTHCSFVMRENRVPHYQRLLQKHDGKRQWWKVSELPFLPLRRIYCEAVSKLLEFVVRKYYMSYEAQPWKPLQARPVESTNTHYQDENSEGLYRSSTAVPHSTYPRIVLWPDAPVVDSDRPAKSQDTITILKKSADHCAQSPRSPFLLYPFYVLMYGSLGASLYGTGRMIFGHKTWY